MKWYLILSSFLFLGACAHTAVSPVSNPTGVPVVVRVPGVPYGTKARKDQVFAIDSKVDQEISKGMPASKPDPRILNAGTIGVVGDFKTKDGRKFVGYAPFIAIRANYPPEVVNRAVGAAAASYYRTVRKHYEVIPITDLVKPPAKKP